MDLIDIYGARRGGVKILPEVTSWSICWDPSCLLHITLPIGNYWCCHSWLISWLLSEVFSHQRCLRVWAFSWCYCIYWLKHTETSIWYWHYLFCDNCYQINLPQLSFFYFIFIACTSLSLSLTQTNLSILCIYLHQL